MNNLTNVYSRYSFLWRLKSLLTEADEYLLAALQLQQLIVLQQRRVVCRLLHFLYYVLQTVNRIIRKYSNMVTTHKAGWIAGV